MHLTFPSLWGDHMKSLLKFFVLLQVILLLTACASQRQTLTLQNRRTIKSDNVLVNTTQRNIRMREMSFLNSDVPSPYAPMDKGAIVKPTPAQAGAGGGLIGGLIVASIQHSDVNDAMKGIMPVQEALGDFNYITIFKGKLKQQLATLPWLKLKSVKEKYNIHNSEQAIVNSARENTTLFIGTTYALDSSFKQLEVAAYVKLDEKLAKGNTPKKLYANNFYYIFRLKQPNTKSKANMQVWTKHHAQLLKTRLRDAASLLSKMIAMDIKHPGKHPYAKFKQIIIVRTIDGQTEKARVIKQTQDYFIVSLISGIRIKGTIYAVNPAGVVH